MPALSAPLDEARENLRLIRQTMERSTKYSTLSGWSGVLIGVIGILAVFASSRLIGIRHEAALSQQQTIQSLAGVWFAALMLAISVEFIGNKRRAARVGKHVVSRLGAHILLASLPAFFTAGVLTYFLYVHHLLSSVWGIWMLCYGLAISAVGLFSVKPVSILGTAFVLAGAVTIILPPASQLLMMGIAFGGFHIVYGIAMARRHGW